MRIDWNMEQYHFLAFDCGATSGRAILGIFDRFGYTTEEVYRFPNKMVEIAGGCYWNVYSIYEHMLNCLTQLASRGIRIDSIGIDTWGVDFGLLSDDGTLLSLPRAYRDPYTDGIPEEVFKIIPREELYAITGVQTLNFNTIFQLYAMKKSKASVLTHASKLLFMPDLLTYLLTGQAVCEYTIASTSGMVDARTRTFSKPLLERLGLDSDILLPITQPGTVVGRLSESVCRQTGMGPVPVVAVAGHDTASAFAYTPHPQEHSAYISSGTWSLMGIVTESPILSSRAAELNFTNEGGVGGTVRFLKNITGMWIVEQCRKAWGRQGRDYSYVQLADMAVRAKKYAGRINPDDPRFTNPINMVDAISCALVERGFPRPKDDAEVISCVYHSLADRYAQVLDQLRELAPFEIEMLNIFGGGSANDLLNSWTEEATGLAVFAGPTEATAIGNLNVQYNLRVTRVES